MCHLVSVQTDRARSVVDKQLVQAADAMAKDMEKQTLNAKRAPESRSAPRKPSAKLSERLEGDAQEMAARLHQLRSNLMEEKQRLETERPAKYGGSRWRSASENRGSIRKYADEVQKPSNKQKPRLAGDADGKRGASTPEPKVTRTNGATKAPTVLSVATVKIWAPVQVQQWLHMLGLDEFEGAFEFHQVDGNRLLSLSASDCTGFGVAKLSARNRLLAEIESLRDRASEDRQAGACADILDPALRDAPIVPEQQQPSGLKHWSQLAPLSEARVEAKADHAPVNLADGQFNEEESHASFMKALLEWCSIDNDTAAAGEENQGNDWVNPVFCADESATAAGGSVGGALLIGSYDEAQAHESFFQALQAWRRGDVEEAHRPPMSECADSGCTTSARKSCWQCYRVGNVDSLIVDEQSKKLFCSAACQTAFHTEHAQLYSK